MGADCSTSCELRSLIPWRLIVTDRFRTRPPVGAGGLAPRRDW